mgnify:CR=1 FL=1
MCQESQGLYQTLDMYQTISAVEPQSDFRCFVEEQLFELYGVYGVQLISKATLRPLQSAFGRSATSTGCHRHLSCDYLFEGSLRWVPRSI